MAAKSREELGLEGLERFCQKGSHEGQTTVYRSGS